MKSTSEIVGFVGFDANAFARRAPQSIKIRQQTHDILDEITQKHGGAEHQPPNREDLRQIHRLFFTAIRTGRLRTEFDTLKRTRQLAWALTYSEGKLPRIVDTSQLNDALQLIENRFRVSTLPGIFNALLKAWDSPNAEMLRAFVKKHLTAYNGSRKFVQKLKANKEWYCEENSATQLALNLVRSKVKLSDVWSVLELRDHTHSYPYFGAVAEAYVALNQPADREGVADVIEFVAKHNSDKTSRTVLSKLIEGFGYDVSEHLRQPVQSYVLREWGDPRIAGGDVRWRNVADEVKQIFTRWITKEDLRFFFDVVAKACDDRKFAYRKAFWLAYLEHISFCLPVLHRNAEYLVRNDPQALQYYKERRTATLIGSRSNKHAFIIQMGNFTFVEFSTVGACYIYNNSSIPFNLGDPEYRTSQLRNQSSAEGRVIHSYSENYSWQNELASWINRELGIKPLRSYQLQNSDNNETDDTGGLMRNSDKAASDNNETENIGELVSGLDNGRIWLKNASALAKIGKPAVPALIEALRDQDPRIRNRAVYTLGRLGNSALPAIPMLLDLRISDPISFVRDQVDSALKKIDTKSQH